MKNEFTPRSVRLAQLVSGIILFVVLVVSAIMIGSLVFKAIGKIYDGFVLNKIGTVLGGFFDYLTLNAVNDYPNLFTSGQAYNELRSGAASVSGFLTTMFVLLAYPAIWLWFAAISFGWIKKGIWAFQLDDEPDEIPGGWANSDALVTALTKEKIPRRPATRGEKLAFGPNAQFVPATFDSLRTALFSPVSRVIAAFAKSLFWIVLAAACTAGIFYIFAAEMKVLSLTIQTVFRDTVTGLLAPASTWLAVLLFFAVTISIANMKFARKLVPPLKPEAVCISTTIRDLKANKPPAQFNLVFKSELSLRNKDIRYVSTGLDNTRDQFADQSSFFLDLIIEGKSKRLPNSAVKAARFRLIYAMAFSLAGAAIILFGMVPSDIRAALSGQTFNMSGFLAAPALTSAIIAIGVIIFKFGQRAFAQAAQVLRANWFETPVVIVQLNGTVNTQVSSTGQSSDHSDETELRFQQSQFDALITYSTIISDASSLDGDRNIWSFSIDSDAQQLFENVDELLQKEGSDSAIKAAINEINDTEALFEAKELKRVKFQVQLEEAKRGLAQLGDGEADENT